MTYSDELYGIWLSLRYPAGDPMIGRLLSRLRTASAVYRAEKELLYSLGFSSGEVRPLKAKDLSQAERLKGDRRNTVFGSRISGAVHAARRAARGHLLPRKAAGYVV